MKGHGLAKTTVHANITIWLITEVARKSDSIQAFLQTWRPGGYRDFFRYAAPKIVPVLRDSWPGLFVRDPDRRLIGLTVIGIFTDEAGAEAGWEEITGNLHEVMEGQLEFLERESGPVEDLVQIAVAHRAGHWMNRRRDHSAPLQLHGLSAPGDLTPTEIVHRQGAMQSQEFGPAKWSVGQRIAGATEPAISRAIDAGEILRTHVLRPTWHFVAPDDIRWLLELTGPRVHQGNAGRYRELGSTRKPSPNRMRRSPPPSKAADSGRATDLADYLNCAGIDTDWSTAGPHGDAR